LRFHQELPRFQALSCRSHLTQREGETIVSVFSCLFLLGFRDNPAQEKQGFALGHRLVRTSARWNPIAQLRCSADYQGRFVWTVTNLQQAFADKVGVLDRHIRCAGSSFINGETTGCSTATGENAEEECRRLGQALTLFPHLRATAIWLSIEAHLLECAISHA
jgi:hypothetical protein